MPLSSIARHFRANIDAAAKPHQHFPYLAPLRDRNLAIKARRRPVANFRLNRRKLKAEVEKLERENREAIQPVNDLLDKPEEVHRILHYREAEYHVESTQKRLSQSVVKIKELDIEVKQ